MKNAKLKLQAAKITIDVLNTELTTKQMEINLKKKKKNTNTRGHFAFRKTKICK